MAGHALLSAQRLLDVFRVEPGMSVVEIGPSRSGHFVFPAARRVGAAGKVYAVDINRDVLSFLEGRRRQDLLHHVHLIHGDAERIGGTDLTDGIADRVFLIGTLWSARAHEALLAEASRLVARDGALIVVDWLPHVPHPVAPPVGLRVAPEVIDALLEEHDFYCPYALRPSFTHYARMYVRN